jgi:hypothetical protein
MVTITERVVPASVGPAELASSRTYVHDAELEGDDVLTIGMRVEVLDDAGRYFAATVTDRIRRRWQRTLQP